jgi:outer membrane protein assembly factor BamD
MMHRDTPVRIPARSLSAYTRDFAKARAAFATGLAMAALFGASIGAHAQDPAATPAPAAPPSDQSAPAVAAPAAAQPPNNINLSNQKPAKVRKQREEKVVESKDTKAADKKLKKDNALAGVDPTLPDKALYDKAKDATKRGRYDVARLLLQDLLNTYPESAYMMASKLAIADSWYKEGGSAALIQAEQEYKDFITFFPNAPEAAEAQMRVGDIYFRQMDKPDRDYTNIMKAEEAYRLMLQQFPDSPLIPQARQRLREVQETLASRESDIAAFYATRQNLSAVIARYQTVVDTYPLYSQMDNVLIALGDAYETDARFYRNAKGPIPEAARARLLKIYEDQAYAAYSKVVIEHSAAPHVEDARDRIAAMGRPVPTPTPEQMAASAALENSRGQYTLSKRATVFFLHQADTVPAATVGEPPLVDPKATLAPTIFHQTVADYAAAMSPAANSPHPVNASLTPNTPAAAAPVAAAPAVVAPLAFQDVPPAGAGAPAGGSALVTNVPGGSGSTTSVGSSMGVEIVPSSGSTAAATAGGPPPAFPGSSPDAASTPAQPRDMTFGGKSAATPLAPIEKAADAPAPVNDVPAGGAKPVTPAVDANGKPIKPAFDKDTESSSKHKKKKGLAKLNPF